MAQDDRSGFLVEFIHAGGSVKVTAIDPESGVEVSIVGAPQATRAQLAALAVRKLRYVMAKKPASE